MRGEYEHNVRRVLENHAVQVNEARSGFLQELGALERRVASQQENMVRLESILAQTAPPEAHTSFVFKFEHLSGAAMASLPEGVARPRIIELSRGKSFGGTKGSDAWGDPREAKRQARARCHDGRAQRR